MLGRRQAVGGAAVGACLLAAVAVTTGDLGRVLRPGSTSAPAGSLASSAAAGGTTPAPSLRTGGGPAPTSSPTSAPTTSAPTTSPTSRRAVVRTGTMVTATPRATSSAATSATAAPSLKVSPKPPSTVTTTAAKPKATTKPAAKAPGSSLSSGAYEAQLVTLINAERTARGIAPLRASTCTDRYAQSWASRLSSTGAFTHQSLGPVLRGCTATRAAENIGRGKISPAAMVRLWMGSGGHRANILDRRLTHVGTAAVRTSSGTWTAVQDFIAR